MIIITQLANFLGVKFPQYDPQSVVVKRPKDCRQTLNTEQLVKQFEAAQPSGIKPNRLGQNEKLIHRHDGFDAEILTGAIQATTKNKGIQRVPFLTDYDKAFCQKANLDGQKMERFKKHWATLTNGKYPTNVKISGMLREDGMGERNCATYASVASQALEYERREAQKRE